MIPAGFDFNKSSEDRLLQFNNVLDSSLRSFSDIKMQLTRYLESSMDPDGWQAIWKVPRLVCEELKVEYPTRVLVYVETVDFSDLTASVAVLATQYHMEIPSPSVASLIDLLITDEQDASVALNLEATANCLDMVTFFYKHVLMPWDCYENEPLNLEARVSLYYDMQRRGDSNAEQMQRLLSKARFLQARRAKYEGNAEKLLEIRVALHIIRANFEILTKIVCEIPNAETVTGESVDVPPVTWVVFQPSDSIDDLLASLQKIEAGTVIRPVSKSSTALQSANSGDTILFGKGSFDVTETVFLGGVTVKSIHPLGATLVAKNEDVFVNCMQDVVLDGLILQAENVQCAVLVSKEARLINCRLVGRNVSTHRGLMVLNGGHLVLDNCEITGFHTGVIGNSESFVVVKGTTLSELNRGIKLYDDCKTDLDGVTFHSCKEYAVWFETDRLLEPGVFELGSFDILDRVTSVRWLNVTGNVIIVRRHDLKPITNLFTNPEDPTAICNTTLCEHKE